MSNKLKQRMKRKERRKQAAIELIYGKAIDELERKEKNRFDLTNIYGKSDRVPAEVWKRLNLGVK